MNLPNHKIFSLLILLPELPSKINSAVVKSLESIIMRCIEKDPNKRYKSVKDIIADLNKIAL